MNILKKRPINTEKSSYAILVAWMLLPLVVSFYDLLSAIAQRFDANPGSGIDDILRRLSVHRAVYNVGFFALGVVTLVFAIRMIALYRRRAFMRSHFSGNPWIIFLLLLLLWCTLSTFLADDSHRAFIGIKYSFTGLGAYFIFAGVFITALNIHQEKYRKNLLCLFCGVMTFLSILIIGQAFTDSILDTSMGFDYSAVFFQHNHFGYVLCMGIIGSCGMFLLDKNARGIKKALYACCMAVQLYGLLLNGTFGSYLAVLVGLPVLYIFYARHEGKFKPYIFIPLVVLVLITAIDFAGFVPADEPLTERFGLLSKEVSDISTGSEAVIHVGTGRGTLWIQTIGRIKERPLFGYGPEGFYDETAIISHDGVTQDSPHNEFLQMAGYTGIPSLLFYLAALVLLAIHLWKKLDRIEPLLVVLSAMVVTYLVSSFFGNPISNSVVYFWMFLGLIGDTNGLYFPNEEQKVLFKKEGIRHQDFLLGVLGCIVAVAVLFGFSLVEENEYLNEYADLHAMRDAELTIAAMQKNGRLDEEADYWYDALRFSLIDADEMSPEAYGAGGSMLGDGKSNFAKQYNNDYGYDEKTDYRDKVIKIHVEGTGSNKKIEMSWVPVK